MGGQWSARGRYLYVVDAVTWSEEVDTPVSRSRLCTNKSSPPPSGRMKPKARQTLYAFTVPNSLAALKTTSAVNHSPRRQLLRQLYDLTLQHLQVQHTG